MCWKHVKPSNYIYFSSGESGGKTLRIAKFIVECEDIPLDYKLDKHMGDWAQYFHKQRPLTKLDLRQILIKMGCELQ